MTYFFDHNLSWRLAAILSLLGVDARALKDEFPQNIEDIEWIPEVAKRGWIALTDDYGLRTNPAERAALKASGLITLVLPKNFRKKTPWEQALWIVKNWPRIDGEAPHLKSGECAKVTDNGKLVKMTF